ncbi:MAG: grasp-with-spasm system SPASM domain peptide maturase [Ferruginibacter sp.]
MNVDLAQHRENYLHLNADCIPVRGAVRSVICDLTRSELIFFPDEYYELLEYLLTDKLGLLTDAIEQEEEKKMLFDFIDFLNENELICFVKDRTLFPPIKEAWDTHAIIQNAIIDVDTVLHDFSKIFNELDKLECRFVQIRSFSHLLNLEEVDNLLAAAQHTSIESVELLLKYDPVVADPTYIKLIEDQPILSNLTLHSAMKERELVADYGNKESDDYTKKYIRVVSQFISSQSHCGNISIKTLNAPSVENFFEIKMYNGCLNRKISVDAGGEIKNCPSMLESYGNIQTTDLSKAVNSAGFKDKWNIKKDQVEICRDCEFRYVCSDCRAYVEEPGNIYSKPLKCGYNPYTCEWEDWSENPLKQKAIAYYQTRQNIEEPEMMNA